MRDWKKAAVTRICSLALLVFALYFWANDILAAFKSANFLDKTSFLITICGFLGTGWGIWKAKTAAEHALKAAQDTKEKLTFVDVLTDLSTVITKIEEIKNLQRNGVWNIVPEKYSDIKKLVTSIRNADSKLDDNQQMILQTAISQIQNNENIVEKKISAKNGDNMPDAYKLNTVLSEQIPDLQKVYTQIKKRD